MEDVIKYLNESPTIFFILRKKKEWILEYVTNNVQKVFGYSAQEYMSSKVHITHSIHKDDLKLFNEQARHLTQNNGDEFSYEPYRIITNDKIHWIQHFTKIIRDDEGQAQYVYGYLTDITQQKELYNQLNKTKNIIETIFDHSSHFIGLLSLEGDLLKVNQTALAFVNSSLGDVLGKKFWDGPWWNYDERVQEELKKDIKEASKGSCLKKMKYHYDQKGIKRYVDFSLTPVFDDEQEIIYLLAEGNDITKSVNSARKLEEYVNIIDDNILITKTDKDGVIIDCSQAFCNLSGYTKEELIGKTHRIFKHEETTDIFFKMMWETIKKAQVWKGEHKNVTKSGKTIWVENIITPNFDDDKNIKGFTSILKDVTDKKEISELLITDYLTKIYNRRYFNTVFEKELKRSRRHDYNFVLMIMDIDYFKQYNDTYGHQEGDSALIKVAQCLKETLHRPEDFAFRLGGEEFGVITSDITPEGTLELAKHFQENIQKLGIKHKSSHVSPYLTLSIGIKLVKSTEKITIEEIYKLTDMSLYSAKENGRNSISF